MRNQDPADALFDLLVEENLGISTVGLGTNPQTLPAFVSHPCGMIASDAILFGEYPNPRTYGCFPIVLAEFVRAEKQLRLPEAIRKMTAFPAQRLGLPDRGLLRDGFKADIVVFNPKTVKTHATREDPKHYPIGIEYVIINGVVVIDRGTNTAALPGRALPWPRLNIAWRCAPPLPGGVRHLPDCRRGSRRSPPPGRVPNSASRHRSARIRRLDMAGARRSANARGENRRA